MRLRNLAIRGGVAVAGVVFIIFLVSTLYPSVGGEFHAVVKAEIVSCSRDPEVCTLSLQNMGNGDTSTTSTCDLTFDGTTHIGVSSAVDIKPAGPEVTDNCTASSGHAMSGSGINGSITLTNGDLVKFQETTT